MNLWTVGCADPRLTAPSAVPYGQAGENAMRFPHLDHRSAADHKLHSTPQQQGMNLISGNDETSSRLPACSLFLPGSCPNNRDRRKSPFLQRRESPANLPSSIMGVRPQPVSPGRGHRRVALGPEYLATLGLLPPQPKRPKLLSAQRVNRRHAMPGRRYAGSSALPWPPEYPAHREVHRTCRGSLFAASGAARKIAPSSRSKSAARLGFLIRSRQAPSELRRRATGVP